MRNTWIRVVGTIGLLVATGAVVAATVPINVSGAGMTYGDAYADARSQAVALCADMGGSVTYFEETSSSPVGGQWVLNGLALCQTP